MTERERSKQTMLCDDEEWVGGMGRSLGQLRGGLLMAVRLAQGWVVHWVGDNEEWVGRVGWVFFCQSGMNRALTVAWRGRGRRSDRRDRGFDNAISLSLSLSLSVCTSVSPSFSLYASPEMV